MINSVTLLGSSSGRNAGDAALISGIMDSIDAACGRRLRYEIPTIKPSFIRSAYSNDVRPISMLPWSLSLKMLGLPTYRSVMRSDLSLVFDAVLFDRSLYNPLFNYLSSLYLMLPRAKRSGKRMAFYNVTAGPVPSAAGSRMLRELAELMDFITVRDQASQDILREIGVKNPHIYVTADAALTVPAVSDQRIAEMYQQIGLDPARPILGININRYIDTWADPSRKSIGTENFLKIYAEGVSQLLSESPSQLLVISTQHHDLPISKALLGRIETNMPTGILSNTDYNHHELKGAMARLELLLGMRLHCTVLGSSALAPTLGLVYQPKVRHYFQSLGAENCCLPLSNFSAQDLTKHLRWGWDNRANLRALLSQSVPKLQRKATRSARIIAGIDRGLSIEQAIGAVNVSGQAAA